VPSGAQLVFPAPGGKDAWSSDDWATWRKRVWRPAAKAAGLSEDTRPRDLRGSFASLLIWQGMNPVEVAEQLGHSAVMCLTTYAGVFAEMGTDRKPAEDVINEARSKIVSCECAQLGRPCENPRAQLRTRTGDPFLTMEVLYQLS